MPTLTERLAARVLRPVDPALRARAARHVLDWLGCAGGALRDPLAATLADLTRDGAPGPCSTLRVGARGPEAALLWHGALGNVLEMDDVHRAAILHPGPIVVPAALAAAEAHGADAGAFLDAIVRGYEATIRIGRALGPSHYRYWHTTSSAGAFGAAAAAGSILGLDPDALADAFGTAGIRAGALWQVRHEPVPTKSLANAEAARAGFMAALLAARDVRGPRQVLEGPQGLFAATAPQADASGIDADEAPMLIEAVSFKPWPACRHAHPAIDALRRALPSPLPAEAIARIEIATYADALRFCDKPAPRTESEAKFSLQHCAALVVLHGAPRLEHFLAEGLDAEPLPSLRARVRVAEHAGLSARFPAHYGARVRVLLRDGTLLEAGADDAWGDPEWPLDEADLVAKARGLMAWGGLSDAAAARLVDATLTLADGGTLEHFASALREAA
jgi:2-methylcitrate dehydratase PrpD